MILLFYSISSKGLITNCLSLSSALLLSRHGDFDPKILEAALFTSILLILRKFGILWFSKFLVVKRREMEKMMNVLKPKPNPQQQLRDWQRRLRQECRNFERQIRDI
ncbi:Vacuolar protein sorting-associated protein 24-like 1, partial [Cucurbita argyrosperma subsp. sororia]